MGFGQSVTALLLVLDYRSEPLFHGGLGFDGLLEPQLLRRHVMAGTGDGVVFLPSPSSLAGLIRPSCRVVKTVLGVPAGYGGGDQIPPGPDPIADAVDWNAGFDGAQVAGHRRAACRCWRRRTGVQRAGAPFHLWVWLVLLVGAIRLSALD